MDERHIHGLIADVRAGRLSRRAFTRIMVGLGLTGPLAAQMLGAAGVAAQPRTDGFTPTRRGFYEPLAAIDPEGNLFPVLAQEIPTLENGGVARDGKSVIWKLKRGVSWHDGKPFTTDDLVFNWEYAADPATSAITITTYRDIERVEKIDGHTAKLVFKNPTPFWFDAFCGARGMIIPRHLFDAYRGAKSREAPTNLKPVGTGPYRFVDFKPGDIVRGEINPSYHVA
ncbi:MAG: peptide ABC transporter substrate-binding protein, partial [Candidatus Rokuibacteriota bacterium]